MVSPVIEQSQTRGINWIANISPRTDIVYLEEEFVVSNEGIVENKLPLPGLSRVPLIATVIMSPRDIEDAQNANSNEAAADLMASIISASVPAQDPVPNSVVAAKDTDK